MLFGIDGAMQAPGGPDENRSGGFSRRGWVAPCVDDDLGKALDQGVIVADYARTGDVKTGPIEQEVLCEAELSRREKLRKEAA